MNAQKITQIQNAVLHKIQGQQSSQAVGLLKYLHQNCTDEQLGGSEFAVFIVRVSVQAHLCGALPVLKQLTGSGHAIDFPVTVKQPSLAGGSATGKLMAPLEVVCYTQPHQLQRRQYQDVLKFSLLSSDFAHSPPGTKQNLLYVLQEIGDFQAHFEHFDHCFASGSAATLAVLPEFDLAAMADERTRQSILAFDDRHESSVVGHEPNYFAQLIAVREKWWARWCKAKMTTPREDAGVDGQGGDERYETGAGYGNMGRDDTDTDNESTEAGGGGSKSQSRQHQLSQQQQQKQSASASPSRQLNHWNEKIAMKNILRQRVAPSRLVPTLFAAYFDEMPASGSGESDHGCRPDASSAATGGEGEGEGEPRDHDDDSATVGVATTSRADDSREPSLPDRVQAEVGKAIGKAFDADISLQQVHVKPSHMCRGLGITVVTRDQYMLSEATYRSAVLHGGGDPASRVWPAVQLNRELFRGKLSKELAPLGLADARRGVVVEPHVRIGSIHVNQPHAH